jgi:carbon monoxide dehydrogenase subunit G
MNLETSVHVQRTPEAVWAYLGDISNVAKWDRGVAGVQQTSLTPPGVGLEFDTLGHTGPLDNEGNRGKMSYRISDADPARGCTVQLTSSEGNARFFKTAEWRFRVEPSDGGSTVYCIAHFKLKFPYIVLAPVFYAMKKAIHSDLIKLKQVLEDS